MRESALENVNSGLDSEHHDYLAESAPRNFSPRNGRQNYEVLTIYRPLRGLGIQTHGTWGSASLHPRLYACACSAGCLKRKRIPDGFFCWRWLPQLQFRAPTVTCDSAAEIEFMLPFHFRHCQQTINKRLMLRVTRKPGRRFVLTNIPALKPPSAVHRRKPAHQVTTDRQNLADDNSARFLHSTRPRVQLRQHLTNQLAVMPLFILNFLDGASFFGIGNGMPVPTIGISGRQFGRESHLK